MNDATEAPTTSDQLFSLGDFPLSLGGRLNDARLSFVTLGKLNAKANNAILILHGYTSSHRFILPDDPDSAEGSWSPLIGPGKAIDTDRYFVISPNCLGSSYGSTGPADINPQTGEPYGPDFPDIQFEDAVLAQKRLLEHLGVAQLHAVVGLSMGGFGAFQWAVQYPSFVRKVIAVLTAPWGGLNTAASRSGVSAVLENNPHWNNGYIYERPEVMYDTLKDIRINTLKRYGVPAWLKTQFTDDHQAQQALQAMAQRWARRFDPNAMIVLRRAIDRFDVRHRLANCQAHVLYLLASTDQLFPPSIASSTLEPLKAAGRAVRYIEIASEYGHYASSLDWHKWANELQAFINDSGNAR
jgi:homoserine O-acetyltransferase